MQVDIDGQTYEIAKLKARHQRNVLRRLLPLIVAGKPALQELSKELAGDPDAFVAAIGPLAQAVAALSDDDSDYIFNTCLGACRRKGSVGYQTIVSSAGDLMFEDISLPQQLKLVFAVFRENFTDFFVALPGQSSTAPQAG